jgi:nitroreductase
MRTARAVRRYRSAAVERAVVDRCLEAATWGPSGGNQQPWRFVLIEDPALREVVAEGAKISWEAMRGFYGLERPGEDRDSPRDRVIRVMHDHMAGARDVPVCVLFCVQPQRGALPLEQGASIFPAMQNFLLAARAQGLGAAVTLWHRPVEAQLRAAIGIPDDWLMAATVTAGWPVGGHGAVRRRPLDEVMSVDRWEIAADG